MSYHDEPPYDPRSKNLPERRGSSKAFEMPTPSAQTTAIIRSLDLRFPPNATTSEQDRETQVLLLASDLADIPPRRLDAAAKEWVRTKAFMPKASELRNLAAVSGQATDDEERAEIGRRVAANYNLRLASEKTDKGIRWIYDARADQLKLVPIDEFRAQEFAA